MDRYQKEGDDAKLAYKQMLDHFLNEIDQVDQKNTLVPHRAKMVGEYDENWDFRTRLMDEK